MKIIGFAQLHNEMQNGNLVNWFRCMQSVCDCIYIYDQASTDGSLDYYDIQCNAVVIRSSVNNFSREIICKGILLKKLLTEHPDVTAILWMDGDTILDRSCTREAMESLLSGSTAGGFHFGHYNLWRSDVYYRVDNGFHGLHGKVTALWRNNGRLSFPEGVGLHRAQHPLGIEKPERCLFSLIHRGFATDEQIFRKHVRYKERGQAGWALDRLFDERTLKVERLPDILPDWFEVQYPDDPRTKPSLRLLKGNP